MSALAFGRKTGPDQRRRVRLGKTANKSSPLADQEARKDRRRVRRRSRHDLRFRLRDVTSLDRVRQCGWVTVGGGGPALRITSSPDGAVAGFAGLSSCSSVWACPVCAAKIATRRAGDLAAVMKFGLDRGCSASMVTLTMRHHRGQRLKDCWDALAAAWSAVTSGKQWTDDQQKHGLRGWVKAVEVTRGENGWHVHLHVLMIWDTGIGLADAELVAGRMWQRWERALERRGFDSLRGPGVDVRLASLEPGERGGLHEYFVKLAHEITGGQAKLARGGGRTPFQILANIFESGEKDDVDAWHEWETASRGRRQIAWSKGLRDWAGLGAELTDEEITEEDIGSDDLLFIDPESWRALRSQPMAVCDLLDRAEDDGYGGAKRWLAGRGFGFTVLKRVLGAVIRG